MGSSLLSQAFDKLQSSQKPVLTQNAEVLTRYVFDGSASGELAQSYMIWTKLTQLMPWLFAIHAEAFSGQVQLRSDHHTRRLSA